MLMNNGKTADQLSTWLIVFGIWSLSNNALLFALMWGKKGARAILHRIMAFFDAIYGLAGLYAVMLMYGPLQDCDMVAYNYTANYTATLEKPVTSGSDYTVNCHPEGSNFVLDVGAFLTNVSSRVGGIVLMILVVAWMYKIYVGKLCKKAITPLVYMWTALWAMMSLASLATITKFNAEKSADNMPDRRDPFFRLFANYPIPVGDADLIHSKYLLNLVFSFFVPSVLALLGAIVLLVVRLLRNEKKGCGRFYALLMMTIITFVLYLPMFIYTCSGWPKYNDDYNYNLDKYQVFVYTVQLPLGAAAIRGNAGLAGGIWKKDGECKKTCNVVNNVEVAEMASY